MADEKTITDQKTDPPSFTSLKDAVLFITGCLESENFEKLANACIKEGFKHSVSVFKSLATTHKKTPLTELYSGKEFPTDETTFKLGGHAKELGHVHIDFIQKNDVWFLDSIWMCK